MIRVVERTSAEMDQETIDLFNECKPLLDEGKGFYEAVRIARDIPETSGFGNTSWYKRFKKYAMEHGYKPLR